VYFVHSGEMNRVVWDGKYEKQRNKDISRINEKAGSYVVSFGFLTVMPNMNRRYYNVYCTV
jgi:hypothetical protein